MMRDYFKRLAQLCRIMFHAGLVGFGGGSALIPILEELTVQDYRLVSKEEFDKDVVVASITPGALPVEIAAGIGKKIAGAPGMLLASCCISFPGTAATVLIAAFLAAFGTAITKQIDFAAVGVSAYIIYVLAGYIADTFREAQSYQKPVACVLTIAVVVAVTCGKQLKQIMDLETMPLLAVSTANVMLVTLFLVFFLRGHYTWKRVVPSFIVAGLYLVGVGRLPFLDPTVFTYVLRAAMIVLSLYGIRQDLIEEHRTLEVDFRPILKESFVWILFLLVASIPTLITFSGGLTFLGQGVLSTVLSFGGGDAYLAVAGGMFVTTGFIGYNDFYSKVVPVANALPGSILCKVLAGVGYFAAFRETGSVCLGLLGAICGYACSVAASGLTVSIVSAFYEKLEQTQIIAQLQEVIRPVVSGLLITVGLQFYYSCIETGREARWPSFCAPVLCAVMALGCWAFVKIRRERPLYMVLACAVIALAICNLFGVLF